MEYIVDSLGNGSYFITLLILATIPGAIGYYLFNVCRAAYCTIMAYSAAMKRRNDILGFVAQYACLYLLINAGLIWLDVLWTNAFPTASALPFDGTGRLYKGFFLGIGILLSLHNIMLSLMECLDGKGYKETLFPSLGRCLLILFLIVVTSPAVFGVGTACRELYILMYDVTAHNSIFWIFMRFLVLSFVSVGIFKLIGIMIEDMHLALFDKPAESTRTDEITEEGEATEATEASYISKEEEHIEALSIDEEMYGKIHFVINDKDSYREFSSSEESGEWGKEHYAKWGKKYKRIMKIAEEARGENMCFASVETYCGYCYKGINRPEHADASARPIYESIGDVLAVSLSMAPRIPEKLIVYRLVEDDFIRKMFQRNKAGSEVYHDGFMSTSLLKDIVNQEEHYAARNNLLQIYVDEGAVGAYVNVVMSRAEEEILFLPCYVRMIEKPYYDEELGKNVFPCLMHSFYNVYDVDSEEYDES